MNDDVTHSGYLRYSGPEDRSGPAALTLLLSVTLHVLVILGLYFAPGDLFQKRISLPTDSAINVEMVSLEPVSNEGAAGTEEVAVAAEAAVPESGEADEDVIPPEPVPADPAVAAPTEADLIAQAEEPPPPDPVKNATSKEQVTLPDKTPEPTPVSRPEPKPARLPTQKEPAADIKIKKRSVEATQKPAKIREQVVTPEAAETSSIKDAIARLRKKHEGQIAKGGGGTGGNGSGSGLSGAVGGIYGAQVRALVEQNWVVSEQLLDIANEVQTELGVLVSPGGHIKSVWFKKRSGNSYLDDTAYRAVMKSNPFPPLPPGYSRDYTFFLRFSPGGLT